jgi:hypothetical protein
MKVNERHKHLLTLVSGKSLQEDVEINGVVYKISSIKNDDYTWVAEGIDNSDSTLLLIKKRKDRIVAAGIVAIGGLGEDFVYKPDIFDLPEGEYKDFLKKNEQALNTYYNDCMLELVLRMDEKVVNLLYSKIGDLNQKVEDAITEATPFLKAQDA